MHNAYYNDLNTNYTGVFPETLEKVLIENINNILIQKRKRNAMNHAYKRIRYNHSDVGIKIMGNQIQGKTKYTKAINI
jgi:hypothetical protein